MPAGFYRSAFMSLDPDDKQLLERELGGPVRGVEFIYRSQGVVRPLKSSEEDAKGNLNHTFYHDQINKVARAVKELIEWFSKSYDWYSGKDPCPSHKFNS